MVCKFRFCVFEKNYQCTLPEIAINEDGYCVLARHVEQETFNTSPEVREKLEEYLSQFTLSSGKNLLEVYKERYQK